MSTHRLADPASAHDAADPARGWQQLVAGAWGREPVRVATTRPDRPVVDPRLGFAVMRTISTPFRAGTRFGVESDVRFFTTAGRLRAPAGLLPGPEDVDVDHYLDRLRDHTDGRGWLLEVTHPLAADFRLWSAVRDLVRGLWQRVGWPALPVTSELLVGRDYHRTDEGVPPEAAGLLWVLTGTMTVRIWRGHAGPAGPARTRPEHELTGTAGDLLYWPADFRAAELFADGAMVLKLSVSGSYRRAAASVKNQLIDRVQKASRYASEEVPYLPYPPPVAAGPVPAAGPIEAVGSLVRQLRTGPDLERGLLHQWAARRSAAGLEPVPPPAPQSTLDHEDRVRVAAEIVAAPGGGGRDVWAVNGHLLPVGGAASERIRAALALGTQTAVPAVCRAAGAAAGDLRVLTLLRTLHRLRALELVGQRS